MWTSSTHASRTTRCTPRAPLTFGTFPALVVEGKGTINQTQAIARYVGHVTGLYPKDPFLASKCDECIDCLTDVSDLITQTMRERDPKRKIAWRQHLISSEGRMTMLLSGLEAQQAHVTGPFVAGEAHSVADLAVWRAVGWLSSGVIDGIPKTHIKDAYPKLFAIHAAIDDMAKVRAWKRKNPHHYKGK